MQRPVQGLPSPSTDPYFEAMKSAHSAAISSNEKIFPIFARKLASKDTRDYINTTHKFASWLGSEKAYYAAARPKIVELLEIALSSFVDTFLHHPTATELAENLRQLIQAVTPYKHLFTERELQSRLQRVILDTAMSIPRISTSTTHGNVPPQRSVTTEVHPHPTIPMPSPHRSTWEIQPSSSVPNVVKAVPGGSVQMDVPQAPDASEVVSSGQIEAIPPPTPPVMNTSQDLNENISRTIPSKPQPKRARRAELSEELIARDLDWFKSNQSLTMANEGAGASLSMAGESSPAMTSDPPRVPGQSPTPRKKTARMVPSRRLPRRISFNATGEVEPGAYASALPPASGPSAEKSGSFANVSVQMDVDGQNLSLESSALSVVIPNAHDVQEDSRHELLPPEPPLIATSSNEPFIESEIPHTDHQSSSVEAPLLNGEAPVSARPLVPLAEATLHRVESMDISTPGLGSENHLSEPPSKPESAPQQSPQMLQLPNPLLPPLVNTLEPPLNLNFRVSQISLRQPQQSGMDANQRRFDGEMTIIHTTRGKPFTHTHMIDIDLNESIFSKISKWVNRRFFPSEAPQGVCISLACYRLPQFFDTVKLESYKHDIEGLTSQSSCSWPHSNRLSLHVNNNERETIVTLSPPLFLTPDQCVDISSLMKPGNNTLEIRQQDDLSEYLIVLHAHHPTRAQLAELDVVKAADERWRQFLDALSVRIVVPRKMLDADAVP